METRSSFPMRDRPSASVREGRFSVWFSQISRALAQQMLLYVRREHGLNLAEYRTLAMLAETNIASIREIARGAELDKAQVTRAVADLSARGLVFHSVDQHDRRLRIVKITPKAHSLIAKSIPFSIERQRRMERSLTRTEIQTFWKVLAILREETQAMLEEQEQLAGLSKPGKPDAETLPTTKRKRV